MVYISDSVGLHLELSCFTSHDGLHLCWFKSQILLVYISVGLHFVFIWFIYQILSDATLGLLAFVQLYINIHQHILKRQCVNTEKETLEVLVQLY